MNQVEIPQFLRETVERTYGDEGRRWLEDYPFILDRYQKRWRLELDEPFDNLSYNLAIPGRSGSSEIVLKLGVPCAELTSECSALNFFNGEGAVRLLDHDASGGALLLERVRPGISLNRLCTEREATIAAAVLMRRIWKPPPQIHPFPSLAVWFRAFDRLRHRFDGGTGPFSPELIIRAEETFHELQTSSERSVILHGDLHHGNVLSGSDCWLAIDPKGLCGDPGYEVGSFMLNALPPDLTDSDARKILGQRLSIFAVELKISRERLMDWAFCHSVLSALWSFEERCDWSQTIRIAGILDQLR